MTKLFQVDAFTQEPFAGNPAAVCLLSEPREETWMQQVAFEMNLSETAFLIPEGDGYSLRWFTPKAEVDLCGHATLASAHVLWETGLLKPGRPARFYTRSGLLTAERAEGLIKLDFPALAEEPACAPPELLAALGVEPCYVGKFGAKVLIEVETEEQVRQLQPDFGALRAMPGRGVVVTSASSSDACDFVSRFFAPWVGVDEDPVTGSAHCCLGPFWGKRLGKDKLLAFQASRRGGMVHIELQGDRVSIGGYAVTILRGELVI
ncbi:MAG: PhzF family phenazine biosynthesis protein [Anaerolineales bacterium]|nr:PhzF family phenazine biosynthesis protein [Anaerolineales bacterium]